jgi:alcohol dehydrogenase
MARAVFFHGCDHPLEVRNLPAPTPVSAEVLVRVTCCTLCASDLHTHAGRRSTPTPTVLGHEIVGRIEAFGADAMRTDRRGQALAVGDRVSWSVVANCGACFFCDYDLPQKCESLFKYGHERVDERSAFTGGLADYVLLRPGTACFRVPDRLIDTIAAPANCAIATVAGLFRHGGEPAPQNVLILGAGALGLTACAMARSGGAKVVAVSDPDVAHRERARAFGATHVYSADPRELAGGLADATTGRGADLAFELAGVPQTVEAGLANLRIGGTLILAGTVLPTPSVPLDPERVVRRLLTLRGVHNYTPADLAAALDFLDGPGRAFPFDALVGKVFRLENIDQAFAYAHANPGIRAAVVP